MKTVTVSLKKIIPAIILLVGLVSIAAVYLQINPNPKNIMTHYPAIFHSNIWILFVIMALIIIGITIALHVFVVHPVKSLKLLEESETRYRQLVENLRGNYFFYTQDNNGVFTYVSDSITEMLGYTTTEFLTNFNTHLTDELMNKRMHFYTEKTLQGKQQLPFEISVYHKDDSIRYLEVTESPLIDDQNEIIGVKGIVKDITEKHHMEREKEAQKNFLQSIIDGIHDPVMVIDKNYQVKLMNHSVRDMMDASIISDAEHPRCYEVSHNRTTPCDGIDHICPLKEVIASKKSVTVIHNHFDHQGEKQHLELSSTPLWDHEHNLIGVIESIRDITSHLLVQDELRAQKDILSFQANHDTLTHLPNRSLLSDRLNQTLKKAHRNKQKVAVMFIDLDHFKEINDSLGHNIGDIILKQTALRLQLSVRESDTVARLGGDEFTVLIENINDDNVITDIAQKIIDTMQKPFMVNNHTLYVTTSIGISLYPDDAEAKEDLLKNADAAMYKAKEEGRNTYRFYTKDMTEKAFEHILLESNLRHALTNNELTVFYQPQVNGKTSQIIGMEALVRWQHPDLGLISPARFLPLAEKTGLIIPLGEQIFALATKQMVLWMKKYQLSGRMAINLSVKQFLQSNLVESLSEILQKNNCKAQWIELEITEDYVLENPEQAIAKLQQLQDIGIEIVIDHFGTGYSSLSYLKRLPINKLKIDQSFVRELMDSEDDKVIITSTISLAKNMKLNIIAEGVETSEQKDFILEQGCEMIQGHYYSRPVPKQEMDELLRSSVFKT